MGGIDTLRIAAQVADVPWDRNRSPPHGIGHPMSVVRSPFPSEIRVAFALVTRPYLAADGRPFRESGLQQLADLKGLLIGEP